MSPRDISVRAFAPSEWAAYKDMRLAALQAERALFATSYEEALARDDDAWRALIQGPTHQLFGLFEGARLIGITGVFAWDEDETGATAILVMSYILPDFRGRGLSRLLFEARLAWARARAQFKRAVIFHRASNAASRRAIAAQGFTEIERRPRRWPDGTEEEEVLYELVF